MRLSNKLTIYGRRALSFMLCAGMVAPSLSGLSVKAAEKPPVYLESSRLDADSLPEGDCVYFGTAGAAVPEKGDFAIKVYRDGSLKKKATVEVHTVDMMAVYGEDYELLMDDVEETGDGKTYLEKYVKERAQKGEVTSMEDFTDQNGLSRTEAKTDAKASDAAVPTLSPKAANAEKGKSAASTSSLAAQKEAETGEKTRELSDGDDENSGILQALQSEMLQDKMEEIDYSSKLTLSFAPGESEKEIRFRILEDDESEGTEGFSMLLTNAEGADIYKVSTASISIQDDEEVVRSKVSFTKKNYQSKDGKAVLKVKRSGAEYSVCDMSVLTSGDTAKAGENYEEVNETLSFAPYETEKEIEIEVQGSGTFDVLLTELKGCEEGRTMKASVQIQEDAGTAAGGTAAGKEKADKSSGRKGSAGTAQAVKSSKKKAKKSFGINIDNHAYTVEYNERDNVGRIMDYSYGNPLEVGAYYFASEWYYGKYGRDNTSKRDSHYDSAGGYGVLKWWGGKSPKGFSYAEAERYNNFYYGDRSYYTKGIPGVYTRTIYPDWASGDNNSDKGRAKFELYGGKYGGDDAHGTSGGWWQEIQGNFGRTQSRCGMQIDADYTTAVGTRIYASDEYKSNAKSSVRFYGMSTLYRKWRVSVGDTGTLGFRVGTEEKGKTSLSVKPMGVKLGSGANLNASRTQAELYPSVFNDTKLVFALENSELNNRIDKFGKLKGYRITVRGKTTSDDVTVRYPEDFESWGRSSAGREYGARKSGSINEIIFNESFIRWIASVSKAQGYPNGYYQDLQFSPVIDYDDVKVTVEKARCPKDKNIDAKFKDPALVSNEPGYHDPHNNVGNYTFHAGDTLNLDADQFGGDKYYYEGYDVYKDDNTKYDTIRSTTSLFLEPGYSYRIRPVVAERDNKVEIVFDDGAEKYFDVVGAFTPEEIARDAAVANDPQYRGKTILKLQPNKSGVKNQAAPVNYTHYTINFVVKDKYANDKTYMYRPKIKAHGTSELTQQFFSFQTDSYAAYNIIHVGLSKVERSKVKKFTIRGTVMGELRQVKGRTTGMAVKNYPLPNLLLTAPTGSQSETGNKDVPIMPDTASAVTDANGRYSLPGIYGVEGETFQLYVGDGYAIDSARTVKLSGSSNNFTISPSGPTVTSIDYSYDMDSHNKTADTTNNTVQIYDDTLTVTAVIDNASGWNVKEAVFTVCTAASGSGGQTLAKTEYRGTKKSGSSNVFQCKIPKMTMNLHNGDTLLVRAVRDSKYTSNGVEIPVEYMEWDTGLVFASQNNKVAPQTYTIENATQAVNVPVITTARGHSDSGLLVFGKTDWDDGLNGKPTGYSLQLGIDASFGTGAEDPTAKDKLKKYREFQQTVSEAQQGKMNAEDAILDAYGKTGNRSNLDTEKSEMQDVMGQMGSDPSGSSAKNPMAGLDDQGWEAEVAFLMVFDFVWNDVRGLYEFDCGTVAVGGSYTFDMTKYTLLGYVPAFINYSATLQADLTVQYVTEQGKASMTAGDFQEYEGNLAERLSAPQSLLSLVIGGKVQVGVGMCGVLDARGYITLKLQFDIGLNDNTRNGTLVHTDGGIGFDVFFITVNLDVANATWGYGTLKNQTNFEFFGGMQSSGRKNKKAASMASLDGEVVKEYENGEKMLVHENTFGTADMSGFGKASGKKKASLDAVSVTKLFDNAAEHTRPQIIPLDGEKKMVVFIGSREDKDNAAALCYSVYDGKAWSEPKIIADDGTMDACPDVLKVGNKVVVAWADANRKFTAEYTGTKDKDKLKEKFNSLGISAAVYDIEGNTMGEEVTLADDEFFNFAPQINADGSKIFCSYMKRDLSTMKTVEDLTHFEGIYSTMAYVTYDMDKKERQKEEKIQIYHKLTDPLVMDFTSATTEINGETYLLSTYTVDGDSNLQTSSDKELFLAIYNVDKNRVYYPLQITDDKVVQSVPKLTEIDGILYLTWLEEGYKFHIMEVTELLKDLFDTTDNKDDYTVKDSDGNIKEVTINKDAFINGYIDGDKKNENWYKPTAAQLGVDETYYKGSDYENIANGKFYSDSTEFGKNEKMKSSISTYEVVSNGDDIYIFYTDANPKQDATGMEIYGVRYKRFMGAPDDKEEGFAETDEDEVWGFGKAVQITDYDKVIDELSLYMTKDNEVHAVSNYFTQGVVDGAMQYSPNKLVEIDFKVVNSLEVDANSVQLSPKLIGGDKSKITFAVENNGLLTARGFDYQVYEVKGGKETEVGKGHVDAVLDSRQCTQVSVPWTIPENVSDTKLKIVVTESGVQGAVPNTVTTDVPYESKLEFDEISVVWEKGVPYIEGTLTNNGNADAEAAKGTIYLLDSKGETKKTYSSFDIPALSSGKSESLKKKVDVKVADFENNGRISLALRVEKGSDELAAGYVKFACGNAMFAELNGGKDVSLKKGEKKKLTAAAAPWSETAGTPVFYSSDPSVAQIDDDGNVTGTGDGETEVSVCYPISGVTDTVKVKVSGGSTGNDTRDGQGTKKITPAKSSVVAAAGKSKSVKYTASVDASASKAAAVTASIGDKSVVSKAVVSGGSVKITVAKKAKKGASTTVTLKSKNAAGKTVSAKIKVTVQNKTKKVKASKNSVTVKKGKTVKLTLQVTAENKKKATTDSVKVSSKLVSLSKKSTKKGKVTLTLKGKKKGSQKVTVKVGSKKVKIKVKVK